jgi:hypothetical protein
MGWASVDEWDRLKAGLGCPMCADIHLDENEFSYKVTEFEHTYVRLPKNQYQRGWTLVVLKRHANELFELTEVELAAFWRDVARVAQALDQLYHPTKIKPGRGKAVRPGLSRSDRVHGLRSTCSIVRCARPSIATGADGETPGRRCVALWLQ